MPTREWSTMSPKFTVAICGGGVAGLTAALAISHFSSERKDIHVDLYEAAPSFTEIGAGIGMYRRPWKVVKALGLEDDLRKLTKIPASDDELMPAFEARKSNQTEGVTFHYPRLPFGVIAFHRADFQGCLMRHLDPNSTHSHFSKRLIGYSLPIGRLVNTPITLLFKDGATAQCDVLIGADGIHSATRHSMFDLVVQDLENSGLEADHELTKVLRSPGVLDPMWSGTVAYRALVPRQKLETINPAHRALNRPMNYAGKNKHVIVFPISQGRLINVVAFVSDPDKEGTAFEGPWVIDRDNAEVAAEYEGWEAEVQQLVQCMEKPSRWAIQSLNGLPICTHNRVVVIGDAAHAMTPHQGAGAGVAIEDAYNLGALLAHPNTTLATVPAALKMFEEVCLLRGNDVQRRSRLQGQLYEFADPRFSSLADLPILNIEECRDYMRRLEALGDAFIENRKWEWETEADHQLERAIRLFEARVAPKSQ